MKKIRLEAVLGDDNKYKLISDLYYYSKRYDILIRVPAGFIWDGDSCVPDLHPFIASCIHDYLYRNQSIHKLTRWQCDVIYYDILVRQGYWFRSRIRFLGLRIFGWRSW